MAPSALLRRHRTCARDAHRAFSSSVSCWTQRVRGGGLRAGTRAADWERSGRTGAEIWDLSKIVEFFGLHHTSPHWTDSSDPSDSSARILLRIILAILAFSEGTLFHFCIDLRTAILSGRRSPGISWDADSPSGGSVRNSMATFSFTES